MLLLKIWLGFARARTGSAFGPNVLFVFVVLMWCTSVSCPVVLDWSVNVLQASEGQTNICRVTLMVVWHCVSHLVASIMAAVDMCGWRNSDQTSGPVVPGKFNVD